MKASDRSVSQSSDSMTTSEFQPEDARFQRSVSRPVRWPVFLVAAAFLGVLLAHPRRLIGESERADAARQQQTSKIASWLGSQDAAIDGELALELARGIIAESERHALDPALLLAVIQVESRFDPRAVSPRGAQGLMQVKPVVVRALIDDGRIDPLQRHRSLKDPLMNVQIGASYLALLNEMFGDVKVALTAYNWGPTRVREKLQSQQKLPLAYATKVLSIQRALEQQLALRSPLFSEVDSAAG